MPAARHALHCRHEGPRSWEQAIAPERSPGRLLSGHEVDVKLPENFGGWTGLVLYALLVAVMIAYHPYVRSGEIEQRRFCTQQALFAEQINRDLSAGFQQLNLRSQADQDIARALVDCRRETETRQIRECVIDRCLHPRARALNI
jgi:hypothetical protein